MRPRYLGLICRDERGSAYAVSYLRGGMNLLRTQESIAVCSPEEVRLGLLTREARIVQNGPSPTWAVGERSTGSQFLEL